MVRKLDPQGEGDIFALDIGTRNVVGMLIRHENDVYRAEAAVSIPHSGRSMSDGQIEDIEVTAATVTAVKEAMQEKTGIEFKKVAIAAAGRSLITKRSKAVHTIDSGAPVTEETVRALELEAVTSAQDELIGDGDRTSRTYYCVGHTVVRYTLDDYPIKTLVGHKGSVISAELIAAFLPGLVVESLYAVVDMCGLTAHSMTLEPIAAMNVIIPPELRLINMALVDIGAGTSDIAVSDKGSITAYAMATTAGDEITEEIVQQYLVDFETAERMKLSISEKEIPYTDILGFDHTVKGEELADSLAGTIDELARTISDNISEVNGGAPAAVLLVGGGSLIPGITGRVAEYLRLPPERVAVGGKNLRVKIEINGSNALPPEYVTPIGIGITASMHTGYDFSVVTLNSSRFRIFDTKKITCAEMLLQAGFKTPQIIGKSGRGLSFTVNGERRNLRGEPGIPPQITVNGERVSLEYIVKPGDNIMFTPAVSGKNAVMTVGSLSSVKSGRVIIDDIEYPFGAVAEVNGREVSRDYSIQSFDEVTITIVDSIGRMCELLGAAVLFRNGVQADFDEGFNDGDVFTTYPTDDAGIAADDRNSAPAVDETPASQAVKTDITAELPQTAAAVPEKQIQTETAVLPQSSAAAVTNGDLTVILNGRPTALEPRRDHSPHTFLELMALADIDMKAAPPSGNMILTLNGKDANFSDDLAEGDVIVIRWDDK